MLWRRKIFLFREDVLFRLDILFCLPSPNIRKHKLEILFSVLPHSSPEAYRNAPHILHG